MNESIAYGKNPLPCHDYSHTPFKRFFALASPSSALIDSQHGCEKLGKLKLPAWGIPPPPKPQAPATQVP
jgi:hypothetical protein